MVPIETEISGIFGPYRDQDCRHIWSLSKLKLQVYLVPNEIVIAGIFALPHIATKVASISVPPIVSNYL